MASSLDLVTQTELRASLLVFSPFYSFSWFLKVCSCKCGKALVVQLSWSISVSVPAYVGLSGQQGIENVVFVLAI